MAVLMGVLMVVLTATAVVDSTAKLAVVWMVSKKVAKTVELMVH